MAGAPLLATPVNSTPEGKEKTLMKKKETLSLAPTAGAQKIVTLELDGKTLRLGYDFNKICDAEREAGCNLLHALQNIADLSVSQLRGLFLAAIRAGDPASKMAIAEAGALIRFETIFQITEAIAETIVATLPPEVQDDSALEPVSAA
jgi:hypothetical protein